MSSHARLQWIEKQLVMALQPTHLIITDDSSMHIGHEGAKNGGGHFSIEISAEAFNGHSLLNCHRMIYSALDKEIPTEIHALKIKIL
jgi:BolA family transcriptional regulator, general stress-responsive regulator